MRKLRLSKVDGRKRERESNLLLRFQQAATMVLSMTTLKRIYKRFLSYLIFILIMKTKFANYRSSCVDATKSIQSK